MSLSPDSTTNVSSLDTKASSGKSTECALDVDKPFCSDLIVIKEVKKFVQNKSVRVTDSPLGIINQAKKLAGCNTEECTLRVVARERPEAAMAIAKNIEDNMKLTGPSNSTALLNNNNIDKTLIQLVKRHKYLKHIYFHMSDFDTHNTVLKHINVFKDVIQKGYTTLCCVLNTDIYGQGGIHWFCVFCDFRPNGSHVDPFTIEHFNSSGKKAIKSVSEWMIKAKYDIEESKKCSVQIINATSIRHQRDTETECGVYCLYYIHKRLNDTSIAYFSKRVPDATMIEFRKQLFRNRETDPAL
jgi:hypothetical protein